MAGIRTLRFFEALSPSIFLGPVVTGTLLYALTAAPEPYRDQVVSLVRQYISADNLTRAITALKWLFGIGVVTTANTWLSELAQNNFRLFSEKHRYDWPKEVIVVTGATGGFGSMMSKALSAKGANIMALDVRDEPPAEMKNNPKIHYFKCDVTNRQAVADVAAQIRQRFGDPSVLVNNAGISGDGTILDQTQKGLEAIFKVNVISHYYTAQEFLPAMIKADKGHVVTIASVASFVAPPSLVPYANTKVAALAFHEGMKVETRTFHKAKAVKFSCIHPTFAATPMVAPFSEQLASARAQVIDPQLVVNAIVKQILSCRGKQVVVAPGTEAVIYLRSLPWWVSDGLLTLASSNLKQMGAKLQKKP